MSRGAFIVIEGLDRSGKTTQTAALYEQLKEVGKVAKLLKFPDRTTAIGKMIDAYLRSQSDLDDRAIHLLFSANRWELASEIEKDLKEGINILCDRYAFSGIAFSASKGLPYEWCRAPDISLPSPDLVLFLDISPEKAKERGGYGEERYEKEEMQKKVREIFKRIGEEMNVATAGAKWVVIDAGRDCEDVAKDVWAHAEGLIEGTSQPITRLWDTSE
ncbi:hypothetical protein D9758_006348 [Tetrapyrgos nigripes]|uniref:Thymidylate kinase n=1 Tax=Tetrapyrgos nigripes TaxID=182062 RepID=A0A8H5D8H4_9AGAR|nr:hypothetical protein D9758_006348 [Tetrapyrgos nigripes]